MRSPVTHSAAAIAAIVAFPGTSGHSENAGAAAHSCRVRISENTMRAAMLTQSAAMRPATETRRFATQRLVLHAAPGCPSEVVVLNPHSMLCFPEFKLMGGL